MIPTIDHLQITVKDLPSAEAFYDQLMPLLGFDLNHKGKGRVDAHDFDVIEYMHPNLVIGFNSPRQAFREDDIHRRKPGSVHHLAFKAETEAEIDALYPKIVAIGAHIVEPPRLYPQHGEHYYALFFKDNQGIKWELVFEERQFD